jgi:hypothetical protein
MNIPIGVLGKVKSNEGDCRWVEVGNDTKDSGGFFVYQRCSGPEGPDGGCDFDDWVKNEQELEKYFAEMGWQVEWRGSAQHL